MNLILGRRNTMNRLADDLTKFFCLYLQATEHPPVTAEEYQMQDERAIERYGSNSVFHAKVNTLTARVLRIVEASHDHDKK